MNFLFFPMLFVLFIIYFGKVLGFDVVFHCNIVLKVKEWLQNLGIGDQHPVVQDDDEDDETVPLHHDESAKNR